MNDTMNAMMKGLDGKTGAAFDQAFIDEMTVHHEGAIDMARLALDRAQHAEIKALADAIIAAQTQEIAEMQRWRDEWYGEDPAPVHHETR